MAYALDRLRNPGYRRGSRLTTGNAMVGRLYKSVLDQGIPLFLGLSATELLKEGDRVCGIRLNGPDGPVVGARHGVVLATGGYPASADLRKAHLPPAAGEGVYTAAPRDNTGDGIKLALGQGAAFDDRNLNGAFWCPVSVGTRRDGTQVHFPHLIADRVKPGLIAIDGSGRRFVNESRSYHEFVQSMIAATGPFHLICDHDFARTFPFGITRPLPFGLNHHETSGYLLTAPTIEALAGKMGVDPATLRDTVSRFNADATWGLDQAFGRGATLYQRNLGDPIGAPNPTLKPLIKAPFHAIRIYPGDIGTAHGLRADADSRALDSEGQVIAGLYACGNDRASVMGGTYPGGGITLGPALTFAYLAAMHAADMAQKPPADAPALMTPG